jgi:hypothetical protein
VNNLDQLKLHLKNLKDKGHKEFSINVQYLLDILNDLPKQSKTSKPSSDFDVDGGNFADE